MLLVASPAAMHASDLKLANVFSDHMVLQREKPVRVWGWDTPGTKVTVEFDGQTQDATADKTGRWEAKLDPMDANARSQTLTVREANGKAHVSVGDVLIGEVWLGSGQSNMEFMLKGARNADKDIPAANFPTIREFDEKSDAALTPQPDSKGVWMVCSPQTAGGFGAVMFYFAVDIQKALGGVPVGILRSAVGSTPIEAWIDADAMAKIPELKAAQDAAVKTRAAETGPLNTSEQRTGKAEGGGLFDAKIYPLIPYAMRGMIWYQGENNTNATDTAQRYATLLPLLVKDWRERWHDDFAAAWVQLPNFVRPGDGWSLVREAELKSLSVPHTGMAITIDIGQSDLIHPKDKDDVGMRLAWWALGDVYGMKVPATSGPLPDKHEVKGAAMEISFSHANGGLVAKGGDLTGFVIAGDDKVWHPAIAKIDGDKVMVSSPDVPKPVAVRYAWDSNPTCNLFNGVGLPASPFRTDDWPVPYFNVRQRNNHETGAAFK